MRLTHMFPAALLALAVAMPAAAQYDRVERSAAEIALEKAQTTQAAARQLRTDSKAACDARSYSACFTLGDLYRKGEGGLQDHEAATKAYKKGCAGEDAKSCAALAYQTVKGNGTAVNFAEGRRLYKQSCDLGELTACGAYGNMVYTGKGGAKNVTEGGRVLRDACSKGDKWSCDRVTGLGAYNPDDDTWERLKDAKRDW